VPDVTGKPLVTQSAEPNLAILFNEKSGPDQVIDIIARQHAFVEFEKLQTVDEQGRTAFLLLVTCETATADQLYDMIGHKLPDYVLARKYPPSRVAAVRRAAPTS
jgi:hypothetical protein